MLIKILEKDHWEQVGNIRQVDEDKKNELGNKMQFSVVIRTVSDKANH